MSQQQQQPLQSLPSFAHSFPELAARTTSTSTSKSPQPRAGSKRRFDSIESRDDRLEDSDPSPAKQSRKQKRIKSPAVPPPPLPPHSTRNGALQHPLHPSPAPTQSRSSSPSDNREDVQVKEEELDTDTESSPVRPSFPALARANASSTSFSAPSTEIQDSATFSYPTDYADSLSRKKRRVTISGDLHGSHGRRSHPAGMTVTSGATSPLTPIVSPVVMGFSVPRTPHGIPQRSSVDQVRSALSLKQQQKALIEARRTNPNASAASIGLPPLPLPTPPVTGGSSVNSSIPPTAGSGPSSAGPGMSGERQVDNLPLVKRTRSRAATVTTGMLGPGFASAGKRPNEVGKEALKPVAIAEEYEPIPQRPLQAPPSRDSPALSQTRQQPSSRSPPEQPSVSDTSPPVRPPASSPTVQQASNDAVPPPTGATVPSLLVRRRGPGSSNLGVNTSGISNAGSAANTASSSQISVDPEPDLPHRAPRRQGSTKTPILTVKTSGFDMMPASQPLPASQPQPVPPPSRAAPSVPQAHLDPQVPSIAKQSTSSQVPLSAVAHGASGATATVNGSTPAVARHSTLAIPRNPLLQLDPVIRSAPLTVGGRMIISGRLPPGLREDWARNDGKALPPSNSVAPSASDTATGSRTLPGATSMASPTQLTNRHHSQLFPTTGNGSAPRAQVPISTTLRTPHVANFTIPPRTATFGPTSAVTGGPMTAEKQSFLGLFSQFYDSLNDAKHLKTWLEGQVSKSNELVANLERAAKEAEAERARWREEMRRENDGLRNRVSELEGRLVDLEHRFRGDPRKIDSAGPLRSEPTQVEMEWEGPPSSYRRQFEHQAPSEHRQSRVEYSQYPPDSASLNGRTRTSSMSHRGAPAQMPLPPIATLDEDGSRSRRGSIVGGIPSLQNLPPPPGTRSRRESVSAPHSSVLPSPMNLHPQANGRTNSISPPHRVTLPALGAALASSRSPQPGGQDGSPHLRPIAPGQPGSRGGSKDRILPRRSPMNEPSSAGLRASPRMMGPQHRSSPIPTPGRARSPYTSGGRVPVVVRPSPTPSPPPPSQRLVDVGSRASDAQMLPI